MNNRLILPLLFLWFLSSNPATATEVLFLTGDVETMQQLAAREGKMLFVHFTANWCMPCQWMEKNTYTDEELANYLNQRYLPLKVDLDSRRGFESKEKYQIVLLPTILIIDTRGVVIARYEESLSANRLHTLLRDLFEQQMFQAPPVDGQHSENVLPTAPSRPTGGISRPPIIPGSSPAYPRTAPNYSTSPPRATQTTTATRPSLSPASSFDAKPNLSGYGVQVGVYNDHSNARRQAELLKAKVGQPVHIFAGNHEGRQVYRLLVGLFSSRSDAENFGRLLRTQYNLSGLIKNVETL